MAGVRHSRLLKPIRQREFSLRAEEVKGQDWVLRKRVSQTALRISCRLGASKASLRTQPCSGWGGTCFSARRSISAGIVSECYCLYTLSLTGRR